MKGKLWLTTVLSTLLCAGVWAQNPPPPTGTALEQQKRLDAMKSKSVEASLTILPVRGWAGWGSNCSCRLFRFLTA